jgi:DNA-binding CsgD family transcriptional regulator
MTCIAIAPGNLRNRAIDNMGISLKTSSNAFDPRAIIRKQLSDLTPREFDICFLHFIEGRSQALIGAWLGIALRTVQFHVENAVKKIPQLKPLQVQALLKPPRPKIFHLSQLRPTERGPFNADEV